MNIIFDKLSVLAMVLCCMAPVFGSAEPVLSTNSTLKPIEENVSKLAVLQEINGEITGDSRGWNLQGFSAFQGIYKISGRLIVLLHSRSGKGGFIWEPLKQQGRKVDEMQYKEFMRSYKQNLQDNFPHHLQDDDHWQLTELDSDGETFSCHVNFSSFYSISYKDKSPSFLFYIIEKNNPIQPSSYKVCSEARSPYVRTLRLNLYSGIYAMAALPDHTIIIFILDLGYVLHLDADFKPKTTFNNKVFLVAADAVNARFTGDQRHDPLFRYQVMKSLIAPMEKQAQ